MPLRIIHKQHAVNLSMLGNTCYLCDEIHNQVDILCQNCANDLPVNHAACPVCARFDTTSQICPACLKRKKIYVDSSIAMFQYDYPVNHLIFRAKYQQGLEMAHYLGTLLAKTLLGRKILIPDLIIPIPLHPIRQLMRGYNQALEIARPISALLESKLETQACRRIRATLPQTKLPMKQRYRNVKGAFAISRTISCKNVAIVDDVVTTGSTVNEMAKVLRQAGVEKIQVWACAKAS